MDVSTQAASHKVAAAAGAGGLADLTLQALGVPFIGLMLAFGGATLVLSFLPPRGMRHAISSILLCALLGAYGGQALAAGVSAFSGMQLFLSIVLAAALQILLPIFIEQAPEVLRALRSRFVGGAEK